MKVFLHPSPSDSGTLPFFPCPSPRGKRRSATHPQPGRWWCCRTGPAAWWRSAPGCPVLGWEPALARGSPEPGGVCRSDAPRLAGQKLQFYLEGRAAATHEHSLSPSRARAFTCVQKGYPSAQGEVKELSFHKSFFLALKSHGQCEKSGKYKKKIFFSQIFHSSWGTHVNPWLIMSMYGKNYYNIVK